MTAKISIVVPVYNVEPYLFQCLESLKNQSFKDFEVIIVNDGSPDNSEYICKEFCNTDGRFKYFYQENQGLSGARNTGIFLSNAAYISFLDADDWLHKKALELAYQIALSQNADLVFWKMTKVYRNISIEGDSPYNENFHFYGNSLERLKQRILGPIEEELTNPVLIDSFASAWGKLYKAKIIKDNNLHFIDTKFVGSEDIPFNIAYFQLMKSAYFINKPLIYYRKDNPNSLTKTHGSTLFHRFICLFNYIESYIQHHDLGDRYQQAFHNRIAISMMNIGLSETSPRNSISIWQQIKNLKLYLKSPVYQNAYKHFQYGYLKPHWRIFYSFCKLQSALGVYLLLKIMRVFIR